tara:strand:- start:264 stop:518 length:255 start_codon:yes stop_codon:yes gene_type:complete
MEPGNNKSAFKLRSGNKPSVAKLTGVSPVKIGPKPTKADIANMSRSEQQAYGRKIMRGPGTTEEKYNILQNLGIELKGHEGYEQ